MVCRCTFSSYGAERERKKNKRKIKLNWRKNSKILWIKSKHSNYLCVCPNVCVSFAEPEHFGTKLVWHVCSSQHSLRFARDPGRLDCCQFQNCAATLPIALRWMRFERVWFFSLMNLHHQNSCRLNRNGKKQNYLLPNMWTVWEFYAKSITYHHWMLFRLRQFPNNVRGIEFDLELRRILRQLKVACHNYHMKNRPNGTHIASPDVSNRLM